MDPASAATSVKRCLGSWEGVARTARHSDAKLTVRSPEASPSTGIFDADLQERKSHRCLLAGRAPVAAVRKSLERWR